MSIDRLLRESNPPAGMLASPVPQIYDRATGGPAVVEGYHGAPGAVLLGPNGEPISSSNRLPVEATLSGSNVLHELVWNPTPGSAEFRVFGETAGNPTQAIK